MKQLLLSIISTVVFVLVSNAQWVQVGGDIDGENAFDGSGVSVSLSTDGNRLAIGAISNSDTGQSAGHVRIYDNSNGTWTQVGADIDGEAEGDQSGYPVRLSGDGNRVAISASSNDGINGQFSGHVRVYEDLSGVWTQVGVDIDGEAALDQSGYSAAINDDGSIVAIGAYLNDGNGTDSGHTRVYQDSSGVWVQLGADIDGDATGYAAGTALAVSSDGLTVAIGARVNSGSTGQVRVYEFNDTTWVQVGADINGQAALDLFGESLDLSSDGSIVAIGAPLNDNSSPNSGQVRVYQNISGVWTQVGDPIDGQANGDHAGWTNGVSLSSDGNIVAIGSKDYGVSNVGMTRIFQNISGNWIQVGSGIIGEAASDGSGVAVGLSGDGATVAIGARDNDDGGNNAGHVRVYTLGNVGISGSELLGVNVHPNPTTGSLRVTLRSPEPNLRVNIYNSIGELVRTEKRSVVSSFDLSLPEARGMYLIQLISESGVTRTLEVVKE